MPEIQDETLLEIPVGELAPPWSLLKRVAFRFCFMYFILYLAISQMLTLVAPGIVPPDSPGLDSLTPTRQIISWTARHVSQITSTLVITGSGSGDKTFDWVEAFCFLALATVGTAMWSLL